MSAGISYNSAISLIAVVAHEHHPAIQRVERLLQGFGFSLAYLSVAIQPDVRLAGTSLA
jgi:formate/nitrite transporter FocA (FNT family)